MVRGKEGGRVQAAQLLRQKRAELHLLHQRLHVRRDSPPEIRLRQQAEHRPAKIRRRDARAGRGAQRPLRRGAGNAQQPLRVHMKAHQRADGLPEILLFRRPAQAVFQPQQLPDHGAAHDGMPRRHRHAVLQARDRKLAQVVEQRGEKQLLLPAPGQRRIGRQRGQRPAYAPGVGQHVALRVIHGILGGAPHGVEQGTEGGAAQRLPAKFRVRAGGHQTQQRLQRPGAVSHGLSPPRPGPAAPAGRRGGGPDRWGQWDGPARACCPPPRPG